MVSAFRRARSLPAGREWGQGGESALAPLSSCRVQLSHWPRAVCGCRHLRPPLPCLGATLWGLGLRALLVLGFRPTCGFLVVCGLPCFCVVASVPSSSLLHYSAYARPGSPGAEGTKVGAFVVAVCLVGCVGSCAGVRSAFQRNLSAAPVFLWDRADKTRKNVFVCVSVYTACAPCCMVFPGAPTLACGRPFGCMLATLVKLVVVQGETLKLG
jgi:hypothetical protein